MISIVGDIAVDIVSTLKRPLLRGSDAPASVRLSPGGSGANVAVWLARLGHPAAFIGRIGEDYFGQWLANDLIAEGVTPHLIRDPQRDTSVIQVLVEPDGQRTMIPDRGASAWWDPEDIPETVIAQADLLHVVGYVLLDCDGRRGALRAIQLARQHHVPVSLDPSSHGPLNALGARRFWSLVGDVDILLPNRDEAQVLSGRADPDAAVEVLQEHAGIVVIKLDRQGCLAGQREQRWRVPSPRITVGNTTGAGDAFDAGFLASWVATGDIGTACRRAVELGARAATLSSTR